MCVSHLWNKSATPHRKGERSKREHNTQEQGDLLKYKLYEKIKDLCTCAMSYIHYTCIHELTSFISLVV